MYKETVTVRNWNETCQGPWCPGRSSNTAHVKKKPEALLPQSTCWLVTYGRVNWNQEYINWYQGQSLDMVWVFWSTICGKSQGRQELMQLAGHIIDSNEVTAAEQWKIYKTLLSWWLCPRISRKDERTWRKMSCKLAPAMGNLPPPPIINQTILQALKMSLYFIYI
jgi:hypothetical protein